MLAENLKSTIDFWLENLDQYNYFTQLCTKPSKNAWSMGQMYLHLINDNNFYFDQIKICLSNNDNALEEASPDAKNMLHQNGFPNEVIEGDPSNQYLPQPESKKQLINAFLNIKNELITIELLMAASTFKGKTKHPGLNYFNAAEWLQFADMHFRHHLKQRKE